MYIYFKKLPNFKFKFIMVNFFYRDYNTVEN